MKLPGKPLILTILFFTMNAIATTGIAETQTTINAKTIKITAHGMVCSFCAQGIQARFRRLQAVDQLAINLTHKTIIIGEKENETLSDKTIEEAIKDAGFKLVAIERVNDSFQTVVSNLKQE